MTCFLIGVSLSMDAFSMALIYGTYGLDKVKMLVLSSVVGVFHFFMPLLGLLVGKLLISRFSFDLNLMVSIIFLIIGLEMIVSIGKDEEVKMITSWVGFLLFGLSVSIDSFTTGIGLSVISSNYVLVALMFMVVSGLFTYFGLRMGNRLNNRFGKASTIIGGLIMCVLAIYQLFI